MDKGRERGRGGGRRRSKNKEFMDAALDAFIRYEALALWREFSAARVAEPGAPPAALLTRVEPSGLRGRYAALWASAWQTHVLPAAGGNDGVLYGALESAVSEGVHAERTARLEGADQPLEDLPDYNQFIDRALGQLLAEASGENEE